MNELLAVFRRELGGYFATPLAFVFIVIFLFTMGAFTFYLGGYYESGQADLAIFFEFSSLALSLPDPGDLDAPLG